MHREVSPSTHSLTTPSMGPKNPISLDSLSNVGIALAVAKRTRTVMYRIIVKYQITPTESLAQSVAPMLRRPVLSILPHSTRTVKKSELNRLRLKWWRWIHSFFCDYEPLLCVTRLLLVWVWLSIMVIYIFVNFWMLVMVWINITWYCYWVLLFFTS